MEQEQNTICSCRGSGVFFDRRHLSWMLSGIVFLSFGFFICGYFMGKRMAIQELQSTVDQDSLSDKIYASLCAVQDDMISAKAYYENNQEEGESCENATAVSIDVHGSEVEKESQENQAENAKDEDVKYYAQLVGFSTEAAAKKCAQRMHKKNMPVLVKQRYSKTAKGKKISWYQIITEEMENKDNLEKLVEEIKLKERLKDVRILTC